MIGRRQSIGLDGALKTVSREKIKRKKPRVVIIEEPDSERTHTDEEPLVGPANAIPDSDEKRKGKAVASKQPKSGRRKSVVVHCPLSGVRIAEAPSLQAENQFEGPADPPIPDIEPEQHDVELGGPRHIVDVSESLPASAIDTSGWSGGLHIHTLFTAQHIFLTVNNILQTATDSSWFAFQVRCLGKVLCLVVCATSAVIMSHAGERARGIMTQDTLVRRSPTETGDTFTDPDLALLLPGPPHLLR